jgi:hypothetical protein
MPKPVPFNYPQQSHPEPYAAPSKPSGKFFKRQFLLFICLSFIAINKPSFNVNIQAATGSGNRVFKKNTKGSALLNRNDNANQKAMCYACGINIR